MRKWIKKRITLWLAIALTIVQCNPVLAAGWEERDGLAVYEQCFEEQGVVITLTTEPGWIPADAEVEFEFTNTDATGISESALLEAIEEGEKQSDDPTNIFNQFDCLEGSLNSTFAFTFHIYAQNEDGSRTEFVPDDAHPVMVKVENFASDAQDPDGISKVSVISVNEEFVLDDTSQVSDVVENLGEVYFEATVQTYVIAKAEYRSRLTSPDKLQAQKFVFNTINNYCDWSRFLTDPSFTLSAEDQATIRAIAEAETKGCTTQAQKIRKLADYVSYNISYNHVNTQCSPNPMDVLRTKLAVCAGYSALMRELCIQIGIPCMDIIGKDHEFNFVYDRDNRRWLCIDTTWRSQNHYRMVNGAAQNSIGQSRSWYDNSNLWFDVTPDFMAGTTNHEAYQIDNILLPDHQDCWYSICADSDTNNWYEYMLDNDFAEWPYMDWDAGICGFVNANIAATDNVLGFPVKYIRLTGNNEIVKNVDLSKTQIKNPGRWSNATNLTTLKLPATVTEIADWSFADLKQLKSVSFGSGLTKIGSAAFYRDSALTELNLPSGVTEIKDFAFSDCYSLAKASLGNSLKTIGYCAFQSCPALTEISMPATITSIGKNAFLTSGGVKTVVTSSLSGDSIKQISDTNAWTGRTVTYSRGNYWLVLHGNGAKSEAGAVSQTFSQRDGVSLTMPNNPFLSEDKEFTGWNTRQDGSGTTYKPGQTVAFSATPGSVLTLFAQWESGFYDVVFVGNGTNISGTTSPMTHLGINTAYTLPGNGFSRKGYQFAGWNTKADGTGTNYANGATIRSAASAGETLTLYAKWTPLTYTITFRLNGGTISGTIPTSYTVETGKIQFNNPTKTGYVFDGWVVSGAGSYTKSGTYTYFMSTNCANMTFEAKWKDEASYSHVFSFNGNGATSGSVADIRVTNEGSYFWAPINGFTKSGYTFYCWNDKADGSGTNLFTGTSYEADLFGKQQTFYAIWKENSIEVVFDQLILDDYLPKETITKARYNEALPRPKDTYEYAFVGWFADENYTIPVTTYGQLVDYAKYGSVTAYGVWQRLIDDEPDSVYVNVSLDGEISVNILLNTRNVPNKLRYFIGDSNAYGEGGISIPSNQVTDKCYKRCVYKCITLKVTPTQLREPLTLAWNKDEMIYSVGTDSVYDLYSGRSYTSELKKITTALGDYGTFAQLYFGTNTGKLPTADLAQSKARAAAVTAEMLKPYEGSVTGTDKNIEYLGSSLVLENRIKLRHYYKTETGRVQYLEFDNIGPRDLGTFTRTRLGGLSIRYCPYSYIYKALSTPEEFDEDFLNLLRAIYLYGQI